MTTSHCSQCGSGGESSDSRRRGRGCWRSSTATRYTKQGQPISDILSLAHFEIYDGTGRCCAFTCADDGRNVEPLPPPNPSCQRDSINIETVVSKRKKKSRFLLHQRDGNSLLTRCPCSFGIWCLVPVYRYSTRFCSRNPTTSPIQRLQFI